MGEISGVMALFCILIMVVITHLSMLIKTQKKDCNLERVSFAVCICETELLRGERSMLASTFTAVAAFKPHLAYLYIALLKCQVKYQNQCELKKLK